MPGMGGPIITAGGVIFMAAAMDDYLRAFDLNDGQNPVGGTGCRAGGQATPMTYFLEETGKQYVVIAAGGHARIGTTAGDYVIASRCPIDGLKSCCEFTSPGGAEKCRISTNHAPANKIWLFVCSRPESSFLRGFLRLGSQLSAQYSARIKSLRTRLSASWDVLPKGGPDLRLRLIGHRTGICTPESILWNPFTVPPRQRSY